MCYGGSNDVETLLAGCSQECSNFPSLSLLLGLCLSTPLLENMSHSKMSVHAVGNLSRHKMEHRVNHGGAFFERVRDLLGIVSHLSS